MAVVWSGSFCGILAIPNGVSGYVPDKFGQSAGKRSRGSPGPCTPLDDRDGKFNKFRYLQTMLLHTLDGDQRNPWGSVDIAGLL